MQGEGVARLGGEGAAACRAVLRVSQEDAGGPPGSDNDGEGMGSLLPDPRPAGLQLGVWAGG